MEDINNITSPVNTTPQLPPIPPLNIPVVAPLIPLISTPVVASPISKSETPSNNKIFYIISGIVILFLLTACYFLAFKPKSIIGFFVKKTNNSVTANSQLTSSADVATLDTQNLSPKDTFMKLKAEEDNLQTFDQYLDFINKNGSKNKILEINNSLKDANSLPPNFKEQIVAMFKSMAPLAKDITNILVKINENTATLDVSTNKPELKGTIVLTLENGIWKLDQESWEDTTNSGAGDLHPAD